ncbi:DUF3422 family protein [Siculibacillus lacustris]|uniref:DUF3422 family protein n=1 Tax=Siculibacillus lacustris TaxID=1549641 RepID=A0A4Q9VPQ7_9HYPH|nr:DUF3422 domain-containing protein [Siculibacillus lacustris]TBW37213.1 DUF3422 family protein [Siculibacillus lacustris]
MTSLVPPPVEPPAATEAPHGFQPHPRRAEILGEVHARPFRPTRAPRVFLHHAFAVDRERLEDDRLFLERFCRARGAPGPGPDSRHHVVAFGGGSLKWERHAEFVTYTWDGAAVDPVRLFPELPSSHPFGSDFVAPGPMLVAVRLDFLSDRGDIAGAAAPFDPAALCVSEAYGGSGVALTDFRQDGDGRTRILCLDRGLNDQQAGALVQRLLEIETYRTLAMLGLPTAQERAPEVRRVERELAGLTAEIRSTEGLAANRSLLERLSGLTADLEAHAAEASYRFGATRAYDQIVKDRLATLHEHHVPGYGTWSNFLARRSEPAMRTVTGLQERMDTLSRKLSRTAQLLRTRVDVDLEQQNRDLLESMNRRSRQQLLLQQTVEGLSVAAVSYYVVGLLGYLFKAAKEAHLLALDPNLATGLAVPVVVALVFWVVRSIRRAHAPDHE